MLRIGKGDAALLSLCILELLAIVFPTLLAWDLIGHSDLELSICVLPGLLGLTCAMAIVFASTQRYSAGNRVLAALAIPVLVLSLWWSMKMNHIWNPSELVRRRSIEWIEDWCSWKGIGFFVVLFGLTAGFTYCGQWTLNRISSKFDRSKWTRTRMLVGLTLALFLVSIVARVWSPAAQLGQFRMGSLLLPKLSISIPVTFLLGILLPGIALTRVSSRWLKLLYGAFIWGIFAAGGIAYISANDPDPKIPLIALVVFCVSVALPLVLIRTEKGRVPETEDDRLLEGTNRWVVSPIWGGVMLIILGAVVFTFWRYDVKTFFTPQLKSPWELARSFRVLGADPGTRFHALAYNGVIDVRIEMSPHSDRGYLQNLDELSNHELSMHLVGMESDTDFSVFRQMGGTHRLFFQRCELTPQQLADAAVAAGSVTFDDVSVVGDETSDAQVTLRTPRMWITNSDKGQTASVLRKVEDFSGVGTMAINATEFDLQDWEQVVRAAQTCPVQLYRDVQLPDNLFEQWQLPEGMTLAKMRVYGLGNQVEQRFNLLLSTDIAVSGIRTSDLFQDGKKNSVLAKLQLDVWMVGIALGTPDIVTTLSYDGSRVQRNQGQSKFEEDFFKIAKKNRWLVKENESGIESFFFPGVDELLVKDLSRFPSLRRLSLDDHWVNVDKQFFETVTSVDLSPLGKVVNLETLHLPTNVEPDSLTFLSKLTQLRELQISPKRSKIKKPGFEQCQALEKLTLLNTPSNAVFAEVARIPNLKELVIVDFGYKFINPTASDALKKRFQGVDVKIHYPINYFANPSSEFQNYRNQLRDELRAKISEE